MKTVTIPIEWLETLFNKGARIQGQPVEKSQNNVNCLLGYIESAKYLIEQDEKTKQQKD